MNERIEQILSEMDPYMSECTMLEFLARHRKMIYFNISLTKEQMAESISVLDMSVRANNCLLRSGYTTIGSLVKAIAAKEDASSKQQLLKIRSLGRKTAEEMLLMLMCYQFKILPEHEKGRYVKEIVAINS